MARTSPKTSQRSGHAPRGQSFLFFRKRDRLPELELWSKKPDKTSKDLEASGLEVIVVMIVLTSFFQYERDMKALHEDRYDRWAEAYSVARWQPKGIRPLPELRPLAAEDKHGERMLLRNYENPVTGYADALREAYAARWKPIKAWLDELDNRVIYLCCWCPHSKQTRLQIEKFGTFCCHNGLIGKMVEKHRPDIAVVMDKARENFLHPEWKPQCCSHDE
jgi:hypothetical protein